MQELETDNKFETTFKAETAMVPAILRRAESFAARRGAQRVDELLIVIRELLGNAIVHGCRSDETKMVRLSIRSSGVLFEVEVDDEGEGFDFESLDLRLPDYPFSLSHRGLIIVNELSEELVFAGRGNRARAVVHAYEAPDRGEGGYGVAAAVDQKYGEESCISQMARN